jgi:hypothetical protein
MKKRVQVGFKLSVKNSMATTASFGNTILRDKTIILGLIY